MIAYGKTLPIMLSSGWLTMMLSSVGPVNSLARVQVVDNHVVLCRSVNNLGYRSVTIMLSSEEPVNSLGYRWVTIMLSSVGPVNSLGYRSETSMLFSVGTINTLGYKLVTILLSLWGPSIA